MKSGVDLNGARRFCQSSDFSPGGCHKYWQDAARPTDEISALAMVRVALTKGLSLNAVQSLKISSIKSTFEEQKHSVKRAIRTVLGQVLTPQLSSSSLSDLKEIGCKLS